MTTATSGELEARGRGGWLTRRRGDAKTRRSFIDLFEPLLFCSHHCLPSNYVSARLVNQLRIYTVHRLAFTRLDQRETTLAVKVVKVFCLDEIETTPATRFSNATSGREKVSHSCQEAAAPMIRAKRFRMPTRPNLHTAVAIIST